jgi:hypothetical protein
LKLMEADVATLEDGERVTYVLDVIRRSIRYQVRIQSFF